MCIRDRWSYSIDGASPVGTIEFKTDRTFTYIEKGTGEVYFYFWQVDGDQLVQGDRSVEFTRLMNLLLDRVTKSLTGQPAMPPLKEFQILAVQPDLITFLDRDRTRSTVTLRRLRDK